jgi:hypothetical protein
LGQAGAKQIFVWGTALGPGTHTHIQKAVFFAKNFNFPIRQLPTSWRGDFSFSFASSSKAVNQKSRKNENTRKCYEQ